MYLTLDERRDHARPHSPDELRSHREHRALRLLLLAPRL